MADELVILGQEGDRVDAIAAMYGIAASLALALVERIAAYGSNRPIDRQRRTLTALSNALAVAIGPPGGSGFIPHAAPLLLELMRRADRAEHGAIPYHKLLRLPVGWPLRRLAVNPPSLGLFATMRLRAGLERQLLKGEDPRRAAQLLVVRDLARDLADLAAAFAWDEAAPHYAFEQTRRLFANTAQAIGDAELFEILGEDNHRLQMPVYCGAVPELARLPQ